MTTEEESKGPSAARQVLAWLGYRVSGAVILLVGFVIFFIGVVALTEPFEEVVKEIGEDAAGVFRVLAALLLLAGVYVLAVGVQLCRGKLAMFADLRSFIGGNFAIAAAGIVFWHLLDEILLVFPYATPKGLALTAVAGLWLWTAAKLLRSRAPVADLRRFAGGNAALGLALFIMLAGTSFIAEDDGVMQAAGGACIVAGIVVLLLAAKLLRVTAKRARDDSDGGQAAKERN